MANRLSKDKQMMVIRLLCEGNSLRSSSRITGIHKNTIGRLIHEIGIGSKNLMDERFTGLKLTHLECDEIWTFCGKKQGKLSVAEKAGRGDLGDQYLWTGLDKDTKLIPCFALGKRTAETAFNFMTDLASRIVLPKPHASDDHAYVGRTHRTTIQISTDGLAAYREAVYMAFGPYANHGVLIKDYEDEKSGRYAPPKMKATKREVVRGSISARSICTSHVERHNATIRTFMKRFTRLSYGFSKKYECLYSAVALFLGYYNFVWRTRHSDQSGKSGTLRPTAAMMAGVTDRLWTIEDFYNEAIMYC